MNMEAARHAASQQFIHGAATLNLYTSQPVRVGFLSTQSHLGQSRVTHLYDLEILSYLLEKKKIT